MRRARIIAGGCGVILGILYFFAGRQYSIGAAASPGPGLYPMFVAGLLVTSSAAVILESLRLPEQHRTDGWSWGRNQLRLVAIAAALAVYIISLSFVGHIIAGLFVTIVCLQATGGIGWRTKIAVSIGIAVGTYLLFDIVLGVPLPKGVLIG